MTNVQASALADEGALAIIGMSGRFPGAATVEQLWHNLQGGVKSLWRFSEDELRAAGVDPALLADPRYVPVGAPLDRIEEFDAAFFGYNPREAELIDPQQRLFLECAWEALERAAYSPETIKGLVGVFGGSGFPTYLLHNLYSNPELAGLASEMQIAAGNERDALASTVAYKLNLRGPSLSVQTFCSTSLVAIHLACQSLLTYECDMALAGGVSVTVMQDRGYLYEEGGIASPDGECRSFDAGAQGNVQGNAVGVVVLKRLEDALTDGDQVYAVIRGSAVNNDGIVKVGYTAPGLTGQSAVIKTALANAGVKAESISYIEAHGSATPMGDAVELAAMIKAYRTSTEREQFCAIGSTKPNTGYLGRANGVTGLIKTALALHHAVLPPSLNFERASPDLDLAHSPFYVNTTRRDWRTSGTPRRAGVSSFGIGGTNAHVILEEMPPLTPSAPARPWQLLVLSARTEAALEQMTANLRAHLIEHPDANLADVAYTLQIGRSAFNYRRAVVVRDVPDAVAALSTGERARSGYQSARERSVALIFPDTAEQLGSLVQELWATEPSFRATVERGAALLASQAIDLLAVLTLQAARRAPAGQQPASAEAALFVVEVALAELIQSWGVKPQALLGIGVGEVAAAVVAGVLSFEDGLRLIARVTQTSMAAALKLSAPRIPIISSLSGTWLSEAEATDPQRWTMRIESTRRNDALRTLAQTPGRVLVIAEPGQTLRATIEQQLRAEQTATPVVLPMLDAAAQSDRAGLLWTAAELWLSGVPLEWSALHADERRRRVLLPTYPFERQRYWIDAKPYPQLAAAPVVASGKRPDPADWFALPVWSQSLPPTTSDLPERLRERGPWLILDDGRLGAQLAATLRVHGATVTTATIGSSFRQLDAHAYTLDPEQAGDYDRLLGALDQPPRTIVHLWSLNLPRTAVRSATFAAAQELGCYSLLDLAQALGRSTAADLTLWAVAREVAHVTGGETLAPEQAPLLGICRVIGQEQRNIACRGLDISVPAPDSRAEALLVQRLLAEFVSASAAPSIAYRGAERWVQRFEACRLERPALPTLRERGVYLIVGGLGQIGLTLAEHLARTVRARLVLTSRTVLPARETWDAWLSAHAAAEPLSRTIRQLQTLEALGAEVLTISADLASPSAIQAVVAQTRARFGALDGVIHVAGTSAALGFGAVQELSRAGFELHFQSKAHGLLALAEALADQPLDFCVLFSSLATDLGGLGMAAFTAASSFMDAWVARHNQHAAVPWTSISWDSWQIVPQSATGMAISPYALSATEGIAALERVLPLAGVASRIVCSTGDLDARIDQWLQPAAQHAAAEGARYPRPELPTPYVAPSGPTETCIAEIWQALLGIERVGIHDDFLKLGGNSLIGTQITSRLRQAFAVNLPLTTFFAAPTVAELAAEIEIALIEEIALLSDEALLELV